MSYIRWGQEGSNVYVVGTFDGSGPSTLVVSGTTLTPNGSPPLTDGFIAKYTSSGGDLGARKLGASRNDVPQRAATSGSGHLLIVGYFDTSTTWDGHNLTSAGGNDGILVRMLQ